MADTITASIPPKGLGAIQWRDILKGVYYAASAQIIALIYFGIGQIFVPNPHWPTWVEWLPYLKAAVMAIVGYIIAKLGVNNVGQIFTKDKPIVRVDAQALDELKAKADSKP